jgi:hypothetical protein
MKKFKFVKPFSSFNFNTNITTKEKWYIALHDPAYLILSGSILIYDICLIIKYCC